MTSKAFEAWFQDRYPTPDDRAKNAWVLAAIRQHKRWGEGKEVSEPEFDEAYRDVLALPIGGGGPPETLPPKPDGGDLH